MLELKHPYPRVQYEDAVSYGGDQLRAQGANLQRCGCGVVAVEDLLLYLRRYHRPGAPAQDDTPLPCSVYNEALRELNHRHLPLIPRFGVNGLVLVAGLNRILRREGLPYRARWMLSGDKLWARIEDMLRRDLPVILSIGPNFPALWQKNRLRFFSRLPSGELRPSAAAKAHYVTATGMDKDWLCISSWGNRYYIRREEYRQYVRRHSSYLFSNIVYLEKR